MAEFLKLAMMRNHLSCQIQICETHLKTSKNNEASVSALCNAPKNFSELRSAV
jgi:hypothetical protein